MMFLDETQRDDIGLTFVLNELSADSPFGGIQIGQVGVYGRHEKQKLLDEFYNISRALECVEKCEDLLSSMRRTLMRFKNIANILKKMSISYLHEIEFFELKSFLLNLSKLSSEFSVLNADANFLDVRIEDMEEALDILDPEKKRLIPFYLSEQYSKELFDVRSEKTRIEGLMHSEMDRVALEELKIQRTVIVAKEEEAETAVKISLTEKLRPFLPLFEKNMDSIGKLDLTIQKALLAKKYNAVCPEINDGKMELEDMVNPAIDDVLKQQGKAFVPVSITMFQGTTLLTGANMGGKSVAVKTAVLNICLCHMGFFIFAKRAKIPMFDGVYLISEDLQSVSRGLSTFGAEILYLNNIVKKAKCAYLFIALDEFARGTNPEEGAIIVRAVARYLNKLKSITIMTTHYDKIAEEGFNQYQIAGLADIDFAKLSEKIVKATESSVDLISKHMDYRLLKVDGSCAPPHDALNICRLLALDGDILDMIEERYN